MNRLRNISIVSTSHGICDAAGRQAVLEQHAQAPLGERWDV